ncbi:MAG: endonuclease [Bacteroidales bacterium]
MKFYNWRTTIIIRSIFLLAIGVLSSCIKNDDEDENARIAASLKTQIHNQIKGHKVQSYGYLWTAFRSTDAKSNGKVNDLYSNTTNYTFGTDQDKGGGDANSYNREHSFPKSWFGTQPSSAMYTDLYHLYPSDSYANSQRSNLPYGKINSGNATWSNGYCKMGKMTTAGFSGIVFEPNNEIKGNLARTYFYFATRYENEDFSKWGGSEMLTLSQYPFYRSWAIDVLLEWNRLDPVDDTERKRNDAVAKIQGKRNPYIDDPELAEYIWGDKIGQPYNMTRIAMPIAVYRD